MAAVLEITDLHSRWVQVKSKVGSLVAMRQFQLKRRVTDIRRSNIVVEAAAWATVPFHMQGRLSLNTEQVINTRMSLRRHPELIKVLEVWWATAQHTQSMSGCNATCLGKEQYVHLSRKLYRAMVEEWDEIDAIKVAEEEWAKDSVDGVRMGKEVSCQIRIPTQGCTNMSCRAKGVLVG